MVTRLDVSAGLQYTPESRRSRLNAREEILGLARESENKQTKRTSFLLPCPLHRLPTEGMTQIKGGSSYLKRPRLKVGLSI